MVSARKIIAEGCEKCPKSEDVWFHAAELNVSCALFLRSVVANEVSSRLDSRKREGHSGSSCTTCASVGQDLAQSRVTGERRLCEEESPAKRSVVVRRDQGSADSLPQRWNLFPTPSVCGRKLSISKTTRKTLESYLLERSKSSPNQSSYGSRSPGSKHPTKPGRCSTLLELRYRPRMRSGLRPVDWRNSLSLIKRM